MSIPESLGDFKPFSDRKVRDKQRVTARASFKAFNSVVGLFLKNLARLFPEDATLRLIMKEFEVMAGDPKRYKLPATNFFREIRKPVSDGVTFVDMLVAHSDTAFADPIPVAMLRAASMSAKWQTLSQPVRDGIWEYVDRLVHLSAQAVFCSSDAVDEMNTLGTATVRAAMEGKSTLEQLVADPEVRQSADAFVKVVAP